MYVKELRAANSEKNHVISFPCRFQCISKQLWGWRPGSYDMTRKESKHFPYLVLIQAVCYIRYVYFDSYSLYCSYFTTSLDCLIRISFRYLNL